MCDSEIYMMQCVEHPVFSPAYIEPQKCKATDKSGSVAMETRWSLSANIEWTFTHLVPLQLQYLMLVVVLKHGELLLD